MSMNTQGRPSSPVAMTQPEDHESFSGHRGLDLKEGLIFEIGDTRETGVDFPGFDDDGALDMAGLERSAPPALPGLKEPLVQRHYTRLSQKNYGIDMGLFPLGSCTMKHNPRLNEKLARLPGFLDLHPLQPMGAVQGALELMEELSRWLTELTGMPAVALSPKAGAHGELTGIMAIRAALEARGDARKVVLCPDSAHGTNPATAAFCGYRVKSIPATDAGRVDLPALREALDDSVAAVMITNPNTCGLFERDMIAIAEAVHAAGAFFYCDGANFNAIVGKVRPGDLGVDAMHLNLHKTFSTPHGGGGPGSGPVVFSDRLKDHVPLPYCVRDGEGLRLKEWPDGPDDPAFGRMTAFQGQMGMYVRALAYMLSHGGDGLRQVAEDAVLNANYLLARLKDDLSASFDGPCMHEVLFDDRFLKDSGVTTLDFAKAMIDEGFHPMTMYFPLVVHGAMLVEPTETESKADLDQFVDSLKGLARAAKAGELERFTAAPHSAPLKRLDETRAARHPVLRWQEEQQTAAE
ncbi:aminomethyl-transferring glycine dehydrogenase subunit GcvPB [Yunchengibacter salinarum]|uniref:aminomethyl-transferring glycine dehydrogenase subunit GcvPB n=1 Tax=Yunchengibacter salinarum TaxID=3133399 RepID=UPI0035B58EC2